MKVIKRYGDALAQVLSPQPDEVTDLPSYFRGVEAQFEQLKIPTRYRARLIADVSLFFVFHFQRKAKITVDTRTQ